MNSLGYISILFIMLLLCACVEPFEASPNLFSDSGIEGALVVEANLINVVQTQMVLLSRIQKVERDSTVNVEEDRLFNTNTPVLIKNGLSPATESGAVVEIRDDNGQVYSFQESDAGTYASVSTFAAMPNTAYQLYVRTSDGKEYTSTEMTLPETSTIESVYAERMTSGSGADGVGIFVDASYPSNGSKRFRYAFEETYKIIAPQWTPYEFEIIREEQQVVTNEQGEVIEVLYPDARLVPRSREEQVCYRTDPSKEEVLLNASTLSGTSAQRTLVHFVGVDNPIISHRYSILVKQWSVAGEAFEFYERLLAFSQSESLFSQVQPGSLEGNMAEVDGNAPVIGYFDVSSEVSQRLFFNYGDFFPGAPLPPYFGGFNCSEVDYIAPRLGNPERDGPPALGCPEPLIPRIKMGLVEYFGDNSAPPGQCEGPYLVVPTICGDCNVIGSNIKPDFWID